jgi:hypothetical protein
VARTSARLMVTVSVMIALVCLLLARSSPVSLLD